MTVSGPYGLQELQELVKEKLEIGLGAVRGVSGVEVAGGLGARDPGRPRRGPHQGPRPRTPTRSTWPSGPGSAPTRRAGCGAASREFLFKFADRIDSLAELRETVVAHSGSEPRPGQGRGRGRGDLRRGPPDPPASTASPPSP
ncbi:MAG: hypothetical protein MZV65_53350 [Chromatiales bacterium]|nr:hypothetical protein [Chromatiales bacterium]